MCGITGLTGIKNRGEAKNIIEHMTGMIQHRGPDEYGLFVGDGVALGHSRLSIIDVENGHQPMISSNSILSFNGEIYNYLELREELETLGMKFTTSSDTEVLQRAIEYWGTKAFERLNGQFALLFWDRRTKTLIAARDRFGIRPLYYVKTEYGYAFSSEIKAFRCLPGMRLNWNLANLTEHALLWNTLDEKTVFEHIHSLPGGTLCIFNGFEKKLERYYDLGMNHSADHEDLSLSDAVREFKRRFTESVKLRLRSDVPVGCYLSGGIDSSVTSLVTHDLNNKQFKTFSVSFSDEVYDESVFQTQMVDLLGSDHHSVRISSYDIVDNFVAAASNFERPIFRTAPIPLYLLSKKVREQKIKVVLTGEAADEILFGYDSFKEVELLRRWKNGLSESDVMKVIKELYPHLGHYKESSHLNMMKMFYEGFKESIDGPLAGLLIRSCNNSIINKMLNPDHRINVDISALSERIAGLTPGHIQDTDLMRRNQYWEMKTLLSGYLLSAQGDRMAMAHGIEGRFPFLDHNLVDWVFSLPQRFKLSETYSSKHILKETFRNSLPGAIVSRPKRPYMAPDISAFFPNGTASELIDEYLSENAIRDTGIFDVKMINRLLHKITRRGTKNSGYRDNMLITFLLSTQVIDKHYTAEMTKSDSPTARKVVEVVE